MPLLDAALAFALTMLALSTVVTMITGLFSHALKTRTKVLKALLEEFFATEVQPALATEAARFEGAARDRAAVETSAGDAEPALRDYAQSLGKLALSIDAPKIGRSLQERAAKHRLVQIGTAELIRTVEDSDAGRKLRKELGARSTRVFDEIGRRWEALGSRYSSEFRTHMRFWSTAIALVLAVALNVDSIDLASTYLTNDDTRAAVVAQLDVVVERAERVEAGAAATELREELAAARAELDAVLASGFPIGWDRYPGCLRLANGAEVAADPRCSGVAGGQEGASIAAVLDANKARAAVWLVGLVATAFLVGLGSPFWYDLIFSLVTIAERVRRAPESQRQASDGAEASRGGEADLRSDG